MDTDEISGYINSSRNKVPGGWEAHYWRLFCVWTSEIRKHREIAKSCPEKSHLFLRCQVVFTKHILSLRVLSQFEFLSFVIIWVVSKFEFLSFFTIWVFEFCHNFRFWVWSQFEFLSFVTIWRFEFCHNLSS